MCSSTGRSAVLWWITRVRSGGQLPPAMSKSCKFYTPSVSALQLTHLGTLVTCKLTRIGGIPFFADHIRAATESFVSKLADAGNPLLQQLGRHLCQPRADWSPPGNLGELTYSRPAEAVPQKTAKSAQRAVLWLLGHTDVFHAFPQL
jgi:hypothetical protein